MTERVTTSLPVIRKGHFWSNLVALWRGLSTEPAWIKPYWYVRVVIALRGTLR